MSFSDFDLRKVKLVFDLTLVETDDLFGKVEEIDIEDYYIKTPRNNFRIHLILGNLQYTSVYQEFQALTPE